MEKKNFNYKLTLMLVGLFVGMLLIVLGNKNVYCLGFGFIFLGVSLIFYAYEKSKKLQSTIFEINEEFGKVQKDDFIYIAELTKAKKQLTKQKNITCIMFYIFAGLIIFLGISTMF